MTGNRSPVTKRKSGPALGIAFLFLLLAIFLVVLANTALASQMPATEPDLTVTSIEAPDFVVAGKSIQISWTVYNQGNSGADGQAGDWPQWYDGVFLSDDEQVDGSDTVLTIAGHYGQLPAGESYTTKVNVTAPSKTGTYYLLVETDDANMVAESNEANNVMVKKIVVGPQCEAAKPVLALTGARNVYWASYADYVARELTVDFIFVNNGPGAAYGSAISSASSTRGVSLSSPVPISLGEIAPGSSATATVKYHIPAGVAKFLSVIAGSASDACGITHNFPN